MIIGRGQITVAVVNDGADAVDVTAAPTQLVLKAVRGTDGSYTADTSSGNTAQVRVMKGAKDVTSDCAFTVESAVNCTATVSTAGVVTVTAVTRRAVDGLTVPYTDASVTVAALYAGDKNTYRTTVAVHVEMSAVWGGLETDVNGLKSQYTELTDTVDGLPLKNANELAKYTSSVTQTARDISLKVSRTVVGRTNLIAGSALLRADDGIHADANGSSRIEMLTGIDGVNCYHAVVSYSGDAQPTAGLWCTGRGNVTNIRLALGKTYTLSCMVKKIGDNASVMAEVYYKEKAADGMQGRKGKVTSAAFTPQSVGTWELMTTTFTVPSSSAYEFVEVVIYLTTAVQGSMVHCYLCQPMLAEGGTYNGWSLSERDREYIGGNMLGGSKELVLTKTDGTPWLKVNGTVQDGVYADCSAVKGAYAGTVVDLLTWYGLTCDADTDYTLSFMARGIGKMYVYLHNNSAASTLYTETMQGKNTTNGWSALPVTLTDAWQRYWVHFHTQTKAVIDATANASLTYNCIVGRLQDADAEAQIAMPKLEKGAAMTDWVSGASTFVEERSLYAGLFDTGIDIAAGTITATADNLLVRNNDGVTTVAVDKDGGLKAGSLHTENAEKSMRTDIEDGMLTISTALSNACIKIGLDDDGMPMLIFTNKDGTVGYAVSANGGGLPVLTKGIEIVGTPAGGFTASKSSISMPSGQKQDMYALSYRLALTVRNKSGNAKRITSGVVRVTVEGPSGQKWAMTSDDDQIILNGGTLDMTYTYVAMVGGTASDGTLLTIPDKTAYTVTLENGETIDEGTIEKTT